MVSLLRGATVSGPAAARSLCSLARRGSAAINDLRSEPTQELAVLICEDRVGAIHDEREAAIAQDRAARDDQILERERFGETEAVAARGPRTSASSSTRNR